MGVMMLVALPCVAQKTYSSGTMMFTRGGHNQWGAPGEYGLLDYTSSTDRHDVDIPLGLFFDPPVPGDWRTGAGLIVTIGGSVGIHIQVWGKNGTLSVAYPCGVVLTYPDPNTLHPGDQFTIGSSFTRDGNGTMTSTAPDFGFFLGGLLSAAIDVRATVEVAGDELIGEDIYNHDWGNNEIGLFNTDLPYFKEYIDKHDGHFEFFNGVLEGDWGYPKVTTTGGNGPDTTLTSTGLGDFLKVQVSITDAVLQALGLPVDLEGKGGYKGDWGEFTWDFHVLDLFLQGDFGIAQDFVFTPKPVIDLTLSDGTSHQFYAGDNLTLTMPAAPAGSTSNNVVVTPTFSMEGTVNNHTKLHFGIGLDFDPFSLQTHIKVGATILGDFYGEDETFSIGLPTVHLIGDSFDIDLINKTFDMKGFNSVTTPAFTIQGFAYPNPTISTISPVYVNLYSGAVDLTVNGSGFVQSYSNGSGTTPGSVARLDGGDKVTTYYSGGQLHATLPSLDTTSEGRKKVTVFNSPPGGGSSNSIDFIVDGSPPTITVGANPPGLTKSSNPLTLISVTISGKVTDLLSGVNIATGTFAVTDEYGKIQPSGPVTIYPDGTYSFVVRLSPVRDPKDKDGRKYTVTVNAKDNLNHQGTGTVNVIVT